MKKSRPTTLSAEDTRQLLNGYGLFEGVPLGDRWAQQCEALRVLERVIEAYLQSATAPALVARGLSKKKQGRLVLPTQTDGRLELSFQRNPSKLPSMRELRKQARELGVDISSFGIRRREIAAFLSQRTEAKTIQPDEVRRAPEPLVTQVLDKMRGSLNLDGLV